MAAGDTYGLDAYACFGWPIDVTIRTVRVTRTHLCGPNGLCRDPDAHFTGSDEEWQRLVEEARGDAIRQ